MNSWENVSNVVKYTLSSNPSIVENEDCSVCGVSRSISRVTVASNHKIVFEKGFKALEEALGFWSPCFKIDCRNGCRRKVTRTSTPREHIFIELDIRRSDDLKQSLFSTLNDFAPIIKLKSKEHSTDYRLVGVVQHLAGHYLAHCWRTGGYWQKFNNLEKKVGKSSAKTRIEPHLAVYVRIANRSST